MFSQLRSAVESLAQQQQQQQQPRRSGSHDFTTADSHEHNSRSSGSFDSQGAGRSLTFSTGQLAESALSSLKKSLNAQRAASPTRAAEKSPPQPYRESKPATKLNLEERLRTPFAIGEASVATTPNALSHAPSPGQSHISPGVVYPTPISLSQSPRRRRSPERQMMTPSPLTLSLPPQTQEISSSTLTAVSPVPVDRSSASAEMRYPEADIPLPPPSPEIVADVATHSNLETPLDSVHSAEVTANLDVESLQNNLKLLEQRFADVSNSYKRLQADKEAADKVLRELTPVGSITDAEGLREHLYNFRKKNEDEIRQLHGKLNSYDERIEELRDTHRLESRSQSAQVEALRKQVQVAEALLKSAHNSTAQVEGESSRRKADIERLQIEIQNFKGVAKEEEEKRVKAISHLKTVRQKLIKAEKDRDDAFKENNTLKEKDKLEREKERAERTRLEGEIETMRVDKERDIAGLKNHFDRELASLKEHLERDYAARKSHLEQEVDVTKTAHEKELTLKNSRISALESSVRSLNEEKDNIFDQLQLRQAELESSQSHLESLQNGTTEFQFQLREATERIAFLTEELTEVRREQEHKRLRPSFSVEESSRLLSATEAKYEVKLADLHSKLMAIEKERSETEATLSRNLEQKIRETDALKKSIDSSAQANTEVENTISQLKQEKDRLNQEISSYQRQVHDLQSRTGRVKELEAASHKQVEDSSSRLEKYEKQIAETKEREMQLRANNKSLREELRKVQSSAALLERQRNPGVGYWSTLPRSDNSEVRSSSPSSSEFAFAANSPRVNSPLPGKDDEEINLEYLRNVILQFLEHKEMRAHLVRVLSIILHFTPQETRRLIAKV